MKLKDRVGFYCQLPKATVKEITRRAEEAGGVAQWVVVDAAINKRPVPRKKAKTVNVEL